MFNAVRKINKKFKPRPWIIKNREGVKETGLLQILELWTLEQDKINKNDQESCRRSKSGIHGIAGEFITATREKEVEIPVREYGIPAAALMSG